MELHKKISDMSARSSLSPRYSSMNASTIPTSKSEERYDSDSDDMDSALPKLLSSHSVNFLNQFNNPMAESLLEDEKPSTKRFNSNTFLSDVKSNRSRKMFTKYDLGAPRRRNDETVSSTTNVFTIKSPQPTTTDLTNHSNISKKHTIQSTPKINRLSNDNRSPLMKKKLTDINRLHLSDYANKENLEIEVGRRTETPLSAKRTSIFNINNPNTLNENDNDYENRDIFGLNSKFNDRTSRTPIKQTDLTFHAYDQDANDTFNSKYNASKHTNTSTPAVPRYNYDYNNDNNNNNNKNHLFDVHKSPSLHSRTLSAEFKKLLDQELKLQKEQLTKQAETEIQLLKAKYQRELDTLRKETKNILTINNQDYECLEQIGKGGSSKVYKGKAVNNNKRFYAIKVVSFDQFDETAISSFKGEIDILQKLSNSDRVVKLFDHSLESGKLLLVMECGDIDLAHVLSTRQNQPFDSNFVRYHTIEMLKCVKAVHDAGVIHSDLKPANFLFVKGTLKLIDFGISNSLSDHTMNVYKDSQIGTPNYMAPETLIEFNTTSTNPSGGGSIWKAGKPSDIWSCGCIIYQMCYGRPPYGNYSGTKRILAITNPKVKVSYPRFNSSNEGKINGLVLELIQSCLTRDPDQRKTVEELLDMDFLKPRVVTETFVTDLIHNAVKYGSTHPEVGEQKMKSICKDIWTRVEDYSYL
ncbi:hypothetical protein CANARDRAFT_28973 [[Candida] arabinofermentans NRRL YB-2248]|uniref:Protein kinase domain-containing protein n=1 Tax=[Candida] arabinofermentans NRRL YB-2248 TaxID=983967 RepID=A0A1E4SZD5_9ASCO|nr:hypothetical protein CANARDRAFT_28973 [[Candida] arabinofermentans NRRL YB-2248]